MNKEDILCPGETIKELLQTNHYTQQNLADKLNMEVKTVNEILNGKAPITVDTAIKLELIFGIDATFWNNLELNYRRKLKEVEEEETIQQEYEEVKNVYKELVKRELVEDTRNKYKIVENFKKFMEVTSLDNLKKEYYGVAYRKANTKNFNVINLMVWMQIGLKKAREIETKEYKKEKIMSKINEIRELTLEKDQAKAREKLVNICKESGIILVLEKNLSNTAIYGTARWLNAITPFIQVSDRDKNLSTFWFSFMHELGHIVNGRKKMCFLDMENNQIEDDEELQILKECEEYKADKFANNMLIQEKEYKIFIEQIKNSDNLSKDIKRFAKDMGVSPAIVAGRIRVDGNMYNDKILNSFNEKIEF